MADVLLVCHFLVVRFAGVGRESQPIAGRVDEEDRRRLGLLDEAARSMGIKKCMRGVSGICSRLRAAALFWAAQWRQLA